MQLLSLIGNLGADAKVVENGGKPFVSFNVANTEKWRSEDGTEHERTDWVSCAYNGEATNLLPYLKAGTKVFVQGRVRTRVYSSEKERRMVAGLNLSVTQIELVGGQSEDVPRRLFTHDGQIIETHKAYYIALADLQSFTDTVLVDMRGNSYAIDRNAGWITPIVPQNKPAADPQQTQQAQDGQQEPEVQEDAPFMGDDNPQLVNQTTKRAKK